MYEDRVETDFVTYKPYAGSGDTATETSSKLCEQSRVATEAPSSVGKF